MAVGTTNGGNIQQTSDTNDSNPQPVPMWSAYNSIRHQYVRHNVAENDQVHTLPLINFPAHEWTTLTTALTQFHNLTKIVTTKEDSATNNPILMWCNMDLYKRMEKMSILEIDLSDKSIASPGPFHTVLCALRCLEAMLESSGLDEAGMAGLYSSVTTIQILTGKHHNRALEYLCRSCLICGLNLFSNTIQISTWN